MQHNSSLNPGNILASLYSVMKKTNANSAGKERASRAPVVMVLSSIVVILSLFVLFEYLSGGLRTEGTSELTIQKELAIDSAVDYARYMYGANLLSSDESPPPVETGGFLSTFRT